MRLVHALFWDRPRWGSHQQPTIFLNVMGDIDFRAIRAQFPLLEVAARYIEIVKRGSTFKAICPFHDDNKPSLNFYQGSDGYDRYRCFSCDAGIEGGDVIDFVAAISGVSTVEACKILTGGDMPEIGQYEPRKVINQADDWTSIVPVPDDAPEYNPSRTFNPNQGEFKNYMPVRQDPYYNAQGELICYVVRLEFDNGDKICPTITYCQGPNGKYAWCAKRMAPPHPLLGLDHLAANPQSAVLVVSGEKCYEAACEEDGLDKLVPVTWIGGDNNIENIDLSPLVGRWIIVFPDADYTGIESMIKLKNIMDRLNDAAEIEAHGSG